MHIEFFGCLMIMFVVRIVVDAVWEEEREKGMGKGVLYKQNRVAHN